MPDFHQKIDQLRDTLVGVVPQPEGQIAQITYALIYKFMNDFDAESVALGGRRAYFAEDFEKYAWHHLMRPQLDARAREALYAEALDKMSANPALPPLFREIFRDARLPYKNPLTCDLFLKQIDDGFSHAANVHTDDIGDAYEYLLQATGAQGGVGQFRTPRHIIQFIVDCVAPAATDTILDPAVGTAGFLIAAYKHILAKHSPVRGKTAPLTADQRARLHTNFRGFDIDPTMVRTAQVNLYLHGFKTPKILPHDTLTSEDYWDERYDIILANPPFMTPKGGIQPHKKFSVPANRSEVLFTDYIATHLKPKGRAGFIVPEGIVFQSGNAYKQLRKALVEQHGLFAVISLPGGVFQPYSGVKTTILLLDPARAKTTDSILFLKIENDGFSLGAQRRPIPANDLPSALKIVQAFQRGKLTRSREEREEASSAVAVHAVETFAPSREINYQLVPKTAIAATPDNNLSGDRYAKAETAIANFELKKIVDVVDTISPPARIAKSNYQETGKYPIIDQSQGFIVGYTDDKGALVPKGEYVIFGDHTRAVKFVDFPFAQGADGIKILQPKERISAKFLYHVMDNLELPDKGYSRHWSLVKEIQIPLPPLEIQRDIVSRIATKQRAIAAAREVIAALETERHHFDPRPRAHRENWPTVKLGDICKVESGFGFPLDKQGHTDLPFPFYKVSDMNAEGNGVFMNVANNTIDEKLAKELRTKLFPKGTIIFPKIGAAIATNKKRILAQKATYDNNVMGLIPNERKILSQYIYLWLQGINLSDWASRSQPPSMNKTTVENVKIPLPPLEIQREYIAEFEQETAIKTANQSLIALMEKKIAATLAELWEGSES